MDARAFDRTGVGPGASPGGHLVLLQAVLDGFKPAMASTATRKCRPA
jgi:hypothetical protein